MYFKRLKTDEEERRVSCRANSAHLGRVSLTSALSLGAPCFRPSDRRTPNPAEISVKPAMCSVMPRNAPCLFKQPRRETLTTKFFLTP